MADPAAEEPAVQLEFQNFGSSGEGGVAVDGRIGKGAAPGVCLLPSYSQQSKPKKECVLSFRSVPQSHVRCRVAPGVCSLVFAVGDVQIELKWFAMCAVRFSTAHIALICPLYMWL